MTVRQMDRGRAPSEVSLQLPQALLDALDRDMSAVCVLNEGGVILGVNAGWEACADRDGASAALRSAHIRGASWAAAISQPVRAYYEAVVEAALRLPRAPAQGALVHAGECNTPQRYRKIVTRFVPLYDDREPRAVGLVVQTATVEEGPIEARHLPVHISVEQYRRPDGCVAQCACCRRLCRSDRSGWDFVPAAVATPDPATSHGLCALCLELYYGDPVIEVDGEPTSRVPLNGPEGSRR